MFLLLFVDSTSATHGHHRLERWGLRSITFAVLNETFLRLNLFLLPRFGNFFLISGSLPSYTTASVIAVHKKQAMKSRQLHRVPFRRAWHAKCHHTYREWRHTLPRMRRELQHYLNAMHVYSRVLRKVVTLRDNVSNLFRRRSFGSVPTSPLE